MTAPEERCWFTLDPKAQPVGPYSIADLSGYAASGLVSEVQVFWKEGKPSWDKLSEVPELEPVLKALQQHRASAAAAAAAPAAAGEAAAAAAAAAAGATAGLSSPSHAHPHHAVVLTGKPSDALDVFKNAIAAVEAGAADDTAPDADPAAADGAADRAATPEELEFEDDDGTMYRWDRKLRKYVPAAEADAADAAAAAAQQQHDYDMEAMTFVAEEEVIPTLAAARAAEEAAAAALEGKGEGKRAADKDSAQGKAKKAKGSAAAAAGEAAGDAGAEGAAAAAAGSKLEEAEEPKGWFELKKAGSSSR
ncbi:hypothetical protein OEZ86_013734 [Tetradesmus obliquus]|nr:hypothetical protein OEZ86_013734 [Tetradesmus obliquus]